MKKISNFKEIAPLILILIVALIGLLGWSTGELLFARFSILYIPMAPSAALSFLFLILSLFFVLKFNRKKYAIRLSVLFSSLIILFGSIILSRFLFGFNWDLENIFLENPTMFGEVPLERMSPLTAGLFILYGISILLLISFQKKSRSKEKTYGVIVILSLFINTTLLIGYIYNAPLLCGLNVIPVALPTAICFWLLGFALFSYIEFNFLFFINSSSFVEKKLTKTLIPLILVIVIIFDFTNSFFQQSIENPAILSALLLIITIPLTIFLIFFISKNLGKSIYQTEQASIESEKKYKDLFEHMKEGFALCELITDDAGKPIDYKYIQVNPEFGKILGVKYDEVIGKTLTDVFPGIENDKASWIGKFAEVALTGKEISFEDYSEATDKWFLVSAFRPQIDQFAFTFTNITDRKKDEHERQKFVMLADSSSEFIGMCDLKFSPTYVNPAGIRMVGLVDKAAACSVLVKDYFFPEDQQFMTEDFFPRVLRDGHGDVEIRLRHFQTGEPIWIYYYLFHIRDTNGKIVGLATVSRNISEHKKAEKKLMQNENRFRKMFSNSFVGIVINRLIKDEQGKAVDFKHIDANNAIKRHLGAEPEQIIGTLASQLVSAEETEYMTKLYEKVVNTRIPHNIDRHFAEFNKTLEISAFHLEDDLFVSTFIDITDRKNASIELENSENKFRALIEQSLTGIYIFEKDKYLYVNKRFCEIFGYSEEEIISNLKPTDVITVDERANALKNIDNRLSGKTDSVHYLAKGNHKDARELWIEIHGTHINLDGKDVITGTVLDITHRKLAEKKISQLNEKLENKVTIRTSELEKKSKDLNDSQNALLNIVEDLNEKSFLLEESAKKLKTVNKELEAFTYSVSHDLKAPLRGIDGYSKLLLDLYKPSLNEEAQSFIKTIRSSTLQMNQIIDDLLDYSRLERSHLSIEHIKIKDLIKSVLSIYHADLEASNFNIDINSTEIELIADNKGLTIALRNLLENAIKFTKAKANPSIQIEVEEKDLSWIISVNDNGIGFDMKYQQKIFDIFQRLQRVEDFPGTGIGLAMVTKAMQRMHGRVWAESTPGVGSTFYLEIPKKQ